jgi:hypothetical protein
MLPYLCRPINATLYFAVAARAAAQISRPARPQYIPKLTTVLRRLGRQPWAKSGHGRRAMHHTRCGETCSSLKQLEHCETPFVGAAP